MAKYCFILFLFFTSLVSVNGQVNSLSNPDKVMDATIHTIQIAPLGSPTALPVINLNAGNLLQISFDDFKASYQDYNYSIELVDSLWRPIEMNDFDYVKGFNQNKITNFSVSSIATQKYFHYQFTFPNNFCSPKLSGNYIFKVYKDGNKNNLVFTKRFYVVDPIVQINASVREPFDGAISKSHQGIKLSVDIRNIPNFQNNQLAIRVIQNTLVNDAKVVTTPSFMRNTLLDFNNEADLIFPAGMEARWLDLQSLQLRSDRVSAIDNNGASTLIYVKPDYTRASLLYTGYKDLNGGYLIINTESLQNENQNDYAQVVFSYVPERHFPFLDKKLYIVGALTNNIIDTSSEMKFDVKAGAYQKKLLLKQGYYSYNYILRDRNEPNSMDDFEETEGNHVETENDYSIFVYYHAPGTINDQIVGYISINSKQN
jgi:hypothetical protein